MMTTLANPMSQFRGSEFYWILGYNESLKPLINFLAFLVPKLRPKNELFTKT